MYASPPLEEEGLICALPVDEYAGLRHLRSRGAVLRKLSWSDAKALLMGHDKLKPQLVEALFRGVTDADDKQGQPVLVDYKYGQTIFALGKVQWPQQDPSPRKYQTKYNACLGFIVDGACEVGERARSIIDDKREARAPETILRRGSWMGLFELFDCLEDPDGFPGTDWNIRAGATQIFAVESLKSNTFSGKLQEEFELDPPAKSGGVFSLFEQGFDKGKFGSAWRTRVLFFPVWFVEQLRQRLAAPEISPSDAILYAKLNRPAWRGRYLVLQDSTKQLFAVLVEAARKAGHADAENHPALNAAADLAAYILRAASGWAPLYCLTREDDETGPFGTMSELLRKHHLRDWILRPGLYEETRWGYVHLDDVDPGYFRKSYHANLKTAASLIKECVRTGRQDKKNVIKTNARLLESVIFRLPRAKQTAKRKVERESEHVLVRMNLTGSGLPLVECDPAKTDFFPSPDPQFDTIAKDLPGQRVPFFERSLLVRRS